MRLVYQASDHPALMGTHISGEAGHRGDYSHRSATQASSCGGMWIARLVALSSPRRLSPQACGSS